jgi:hypothetical protein
MIEVLGVMAWTLIIAAAFAYFMSERVMRHLWVAGVTPAHRYLQKVAVRKADRWSRRAKLLAISGAAFNIIAIMAIFK